MNRQNFTGRIPVIIALSYILSLCNLCMAQDLIPENRATSVCADAQFKLTFDTEPELQSSGAVKLYTSAGTLVATIDLSDMPSGTPTSGSWPWQETLNGYDINVIRAAVDDYTAIFTFPIGSMDYNTGYYVTVDQSVFSNASTLGFSGISAGNWSFTTKSAPTEDLDYTVSADGSGDFATLQRALDYIPSGNTSESKIYLTNGVYYGLAFTTYRNNLTIEGESRSGVIIKGYNNNTLNASTHWRSVVNLYGDNINILTLTMINTTPNGGSQAEVIKLNGDYCIIANCDFYSYQDTQLLEGKVYVIDCMIEGDVDFIWGIGTVYFQSCELRANDNAGYNVMARNDNTVHGYCFADCELTVTSSSTTTQYMGRDANTGYPYAEIVYLECTLGDQIPDVGWVIRDDMDGTDIFFAEYKNVDEDGNLVDTDSRHYLSTQLSDSEAENYRDLDWFFDGWTPDVPDYEVENTEPATCVYEYAGTDYAWETENNWDPSVPTSIDTAIIRTDEVKVSDDESMLVRVEPDGILRAVGNITIPKVELQGGTIKVNTTHTDYGFNTDIEVQDSSFIYAGSTADSPFWLTGTITGSESLTKTNLGILDLDVDATAFTGDWYINAGTLRIPNSSAIGESSVVTLADDATLDITISDVYLRS